jgi:hypothetical protein
MLVWVNSARVIKMTRPSYSSAIITAAANFFDAGKVSFVDCPTLLRGLL